MNVFLQRAVPNEQGQMVLQFGGPEYRLLDTSILRKDKGWDRLANPQHLKRFTVSQESICWEAEGCVDAQYVYRKSRPLSQENLRYQTLRVSYKNQAPTLEDKFHHVYSVDLARFGNEPFLVSESIGGSHAERGSGNAFSTQELLGWPHWRQHFELSGCAWAVPIVESLATEHDRLLDRLVHESD
jgi:hypothetical protein